MERSNSYIKLFISTFLLIFLFQSNTYSQDGTNFDFAYDSVGNYYGWKGYQAQNESPDSGGSTTITFSPWIAYNNPSDVMLGGAHCFEINSNINEYDPELGDSLLKKIPNGYIRSTRINCIPITGSSDANSNMLTYDLLLNDTNCLVTFNFAMVLMAPGHDGFANPFFKIDVVELDTVGQEIGLIESCATFYARGEIPTPDGFQNFSNGIWQNWKELSLNLKEYINQKVRIKILVASCSYSAHWAYGYFVGKVATPELILNAGNGDTVATIEAPSGFKKYEWFANPLDLPESQLNTIATGTPIFESTANSTVPADNKLAITSSLYNTYGNKYFVRLTSLTDQTNSCQTYIKQVTYPLNTNLIDTICKGDIYTNYGFNADSTGIYTNQITINGTSTTYTLYLTVKETIAPTNLVTNSSSNCIQLAWQGNASSYKIFRFDDLIGITNNTIFTDTNVIEGNNYCYKVTAIINNCESEFSNQACQTCLGLNDISTNDFNVILYPNPTNDKTILNVIGLKEDADVIIYDLNGIKIKSYRLKQGQKELEIDVNDFASGVYNVNIINLICNITKKLIIQ